MTFSEQRSLVISLSILPSYYADRQASEAGEALWRPMESARLGRQGRLHHRCDMYVMLRDEERSGLVRTALGPKIPSM